MPPLSGTRRELCNGCTSSSNDSSQDEANKKWVRDYSKAIAPFSEAGGYVNFMDEDDDKRVKANYGANYGRLASIKRKFDPDNVFRINQNINP